MERFPKFEDGPTASRPGPILLSVAATAVKELVKSKLSREIISIDATKIKIYAAKKRSIECTTDFSIVCPSKRTIPTRRGCIVILNSLRTVLHSTIIRDTLIPPPVLPAQAPINIRSTRIDFEN